MGESDLATDAGVTKLGKQIESDTAGPENHELIEPEVIKPGEVSGFYVDKKLPISGLTAAELPVSLSAYAITLVAGLNVGWFGAILPVLTRTQHMPLEEGGVLQSAMCAGGFVALAASARIIHRLGDLKTTLLAAILTTIGFVGMGTLGGLYPLSASAFCFGLGVGLNSISSHIIFPRYYPHKVASALSKLNTFYGVGALTGPLIALLLSNFKISYNWIFWGAGIYTACICAFLAATAKKTGATVQANAPRGKAPDNKKILIGLLKHPLLLGLATINFLYVGIEGTVGTWIYSFVQRAEHFDATTASTAISLLWAGLTFGRMASTRACLKINPKYVTMTAMLILTASIFTVALIHAGQTLTLLVVLAIGFGLGPIFPTIIAQSATRFPKDSSITTSVIIAAGCIGGMLLPWMGGHALVNLGATQFMLGTGALAAILPILLAVTLFPRPRAENLEKTPT